MNSWKLCLRAAAGCALVAAAAFAGDDAELYRTILNEKAPAIVTVKLVLKTKISFMGQGQDIERTLEVPGAIVDESGLVMIAADNLSPGGPLGDSDEIDIKVKPVSLKVIFESDAEEYDAILGAKDTQLNLAFVQIRDLRGKEIAPIRFEDSVPVEVGQELVGVARYAKGFDYAAYFGTLRVTGEVSQPRPLWSIEGGFGGLGLPVFTADGRAAGVLSSQTGSEGVQESGGGRFGVFLNLMDASAGGDVFLLPGQTVRATIEQAKKQAVEALEKRADEEGEAEPEDDPEGESENDSE